MVSNLTPFVRYGVDTPEYQEAKALWGEQELTLPTEWVVNAWNTPHVEIIGVEGSLYCWVRCHEGNSYLHLLYLLERGRELTPTHVLEYTTSDELYNYSDEGLIHHMVSG